MSNRVIGIDPGTTHSAFVVWDNGFIEGGFVPNLEMRRRLLENAFGGAEIVGIEMIQSFGMAVGASTFETVRWIGRFEECAVPPVVMIYRKDVKLHLCGSPRAKDPNVRQALIDKYGIVGSKNKRGPLFGISGHLWSALAVADFTIAKYRIP